MKGFEILFSERVYKKLKKIPKDRSRQILLKINLIIKSPEILDIKKMEGRINTYRLRVGDYRIIFIVDFFSKKIKIDAIGTRKEIEKHY